MSPSRVMEGKFNVVVCQNDNEAFAQPDAMKAAGISTVVMVM